MRLKNYIILLACVLAVNTATAQETSKKTNRLTDSVTEVYNVLKVNKNIKQGLYQAVYQENIPVATGMYDNDKRVGTWRFFDPKGKLMETYDYSNGKLGFEAPETEVSNLRYFADIEIDSADVVNKPVKIGGRYFGYLPYVQLFKLPKDIWDIDRNKYIAQVELLISPLGRLAYYWVHITGYNYDRTIKMSLNLPNEDDKIFKPATKNGEPVACRIIIRARITEYGNLDFLAK
ncbi:hypothetical protein [Mucilaginibacter sp.]|uniref:hypothetical protein n=1 Tax=Mucilaginibacter sp. TaxID=1882438 RepID=UPI0032640DBF